MGSVVRPHIFIFLRQAVILLAATGLISGCSLKHQELAYPRTLSSSPRSPALRQNFALFRGPSEELPPGLRSHLAALLRRKATASFHPTLVQRGSTADGVVWAFLDRRAVCIAHAGRGSVACSTVNRVMSMGLTLGMFVAPTKRNPKPHSFLLVGLAPDRVREARMLIGRRKGNVRVHDNLFSSSGHKPVLVKGFVRR